MQLFILGIVCVIVLKLAIELAKIPAVRGKYGEWFISAVMKMTLPKEDYVVLNDVYLPLEDGTTTQIDHIIVSRYGIFVVETKNYSGWIFADANSKVWTQTIYRKKNTFQNPIRQNYKHVCAIADNLQIDKRYLKGMVVFIGGSQFKTAKPEAVVYPCEIGTYVKSFRQEIIKDDQVPEIADVILEWQGTLSREQIASHVKNLKDRHNCPK